MVEPIRKPVHRPRPPHPHTQSRPHAVLVRSRLLAKELDTTPPLPEETPQPVSLTLLPPPLESRPDPLPMDFPSQGEQAARERSARGLLLTALALHAGALLTPLAGASADLGPAELLLAGCVLLSGGMMLVLGRR